MPSRSVHLYICRRLNVFKRARILQDFHTYGLGCKKQHVQIEAGTSCLLCIFVYARIQRMDRCDPVTCISELNLK